MLRRLAAAVIAVGLLAAVYAWRVRPWYHNWGATPAEIVAPLPGDEIVGVGARQETRAITIDAPAARVWPWVAQLGQDRGGFYSYDLLENLVGAKMPTVDRLDPGKQQWQAGDRLWMYPPERAGSIGFATLRTYIPGRALGFGTHAPGTPTGAADDGSWSFIVNPIDAGHSRLLVRGRVVATPTQLGQWFDTGIFEPSHFVMERRMLLGIKALAEGRDRDRIVNHVNVALWIAVFAVFAIAFIRIFTRPRVFGPMAVAVGAGAAFQVLTLVQPATAVAIVLAVACIVFLQFTGGRLLPAGSPS